MKYDIIIIGTGAGGGTIAAKLAPTGKQILIIERGDFIPREKENWDTEAVFVNAKYKARESWVDNNGKKFYPGTHYCVGGNTKFYGAALLRMRERDFGELIHHDGVSPAWPLTYNDFKDYYQEAEEMYHVHGERGTDICEPDEDRPFPEKPLSHEPRIQELFDDLKKIGLKPFPLPIGVKNGVREDRPLVLDRFDGYPDPTETKADSHVIGIKKALEFPNVTLKTNTMAAKLVTTSEGRRVERVEVISDNKKAHFEAQTIILACGAVCSSVLLLRSKNGQHPDGLANSSGMVGRNYMCHNNSLMIAVSKKPNNTKFGKTFAINDFYFTGDEHFPYPLGHIQMLAKSDAAMFKSEVPRIVPEFALEKVASHALDFWLTSEDLPNPENRVRVLSDGRIQLNYTPNNLVGHDLLKEKLKQALNRIASNVIILPKHIYLAKKIPLAGTAHQCGTLRFGKDPKTSVLDVNCKTHDVDNLYVVDSSFFPSSSAVNPALTIMANALRIGDHLKEIFQTNEFKREIV